MSKPLYLEVIQGCEGPCIAIGDDNGSHRLAGPKPWGGGRTIHQWKIDPDELLRELTALMRVREEQEAQS